MLIREQAVYGEFFPLPSGEFFLIRGYFCLYAENLCYMGELLLIRKELSPHPIAFLLICGEPLLILGELLLIRKVLSSHPTAFLLICGESSYMGELLLIRGELSSPHSISPYMRAFSLIYTTGLNATPLHLAKIRGDNMFSFEHAGFAGKIYRK